MALAIGNRQIEGGQIAISIGGGGLSRTRSSLTRARAAARSRFIFQLPATNARRKSVLPMAQMKRTRRQSSPNLLWRASPVLEAGMRNLSNWAIQAERRADSRE